MSTHLSVRAPDTFVIAPADQELLREALVSWHQADKFSDDKVAQVKWSFQRWIVETAWSKLNESSPPL